MNREHSYTGSITVNKIKAPQSSSYQFNNWFSDALAILSGAICCTEGLECLLTGDV